MPKVLIDKNVCKGCELCVKACPQQILAMTSEINDKGYFYSHVVEQPRCIGCRICAITCPDVAIEIDVNGMTYKLFNY